MKVSSNKHSPVRRKLHGSSAQRDAFLSSPPPSPSGRSDGCHSTALIASVGTSKQTNTQIISYAAHTAHFFTRLHRKGKSRYLEISSFFKDSNYRFVDVSNELVSLRFPQIVHTHLQLLHQGVLHSATRARRT